MGRHGWNLFVALAVAPASAACGFEVNFSDARFRCASSADCPDGQACAAGYCTSSGFGRDAGGGDGAPAETAADGGPDSELLVFLPVRDAFVDSAAPELNQGASQVLRADGDPVVTSYIDFRQDSLDDIDERFDIQRVTLDVYSLEAHAGYEVYRVNAAWSEGAVTFANAPPVGDAVGSSGPVAADGWSSVELELTAVDSDLESFAVTTVSDDALSLASRETADRAPRLIYVVAAE